MLRCCQRLVCFACDAAGTPRVKTPRTRAAERDSLQLAQSAQIGLGKSVRHCVSSTFRHRLFTAIRSPSAAFSLPFPDLPPPFRCLSLSHHCLFAAAQTAIVKALLEAGVVTRAGYREMHTRVSKAMAGPRDGWTEETATATATVDWSEDIRRFSPEAAIMTWLETVRQQFRDSAAKVRHCRPVDLPLPSLDLSTAVP